MILGDLLTRLSWMRQKSSNVTELRAIAELQDVLENERNRAIEREWRAKRQQAEKERLGRVVARHPRA